MGVKPSRTVDSLVEAIRGQIEDGSLHAGESLPAEQSISTAFGVSRGTVRRAIDRLSEIGVITRRPYASPVIAAPRTAQSAGNEVCVWVSRPIADDQALVLLKEISKGLRGTNYRLVVREPTRFVGNVVKSEERDFLISVLENPGVAGAIIERDPFSNNDDVFRQLVQKGKHLIFVDTPPPVGIASDFVGTTNLVAARTCVEHLQKLGHSKIHFVADCDISPATKDRMKGYWRAMRQAGMESHGKELIGSKLPHSQTTEAILGGPFARVIKKSKYFSDLAIRIVEEIERSVPRPTAIFVCHDVMAFWVRALLEGKGYSVPGDISIVGFDWLARSDDAIPDILTTAGQDFEGFGRHAANLLLDRLNGEAPPEPRHVLLDAPLEVRSSSTSDLLLPVPEPVTSARAMLPNS
jgi:DNA-binding LacI/PurR family transcriptional regulator